MAIPRGTLLAILITGTVYLGVAITAGEGRILLFPNIFFGRNPGMMFWSCWDGSNLPLSAFSLCHSDKV